MNEKVFEKVTQYIDALAAKLGVAAEHVYGVLVRQQVAEGIVDIIVGALVLAVLIFALMVLIKKVELPRIVDEFDLLGYVFVAAILLLIIGLPGSYAVSEISDGIKHVINPEYYAIREILNAIK
jgi:small-conductance mechanosensitive channel